MPLDLDPNAKNPQNGGGDDPSLVPPDKQPPAPPVPPTPPAPPADTIEADGARKDARGNVILPQAAMTARLARAQETARKQVQQQLDKDAQDLGYANHQQMIAGLKKNRDAPPPPAQQRPNQGNGKGNRPPPSDLEQRMANLEKANQNAVAQLEAERKSRRIEVNRRRRAEEELKDQQIDQALREDCIGAGARNVRIVSMLLRERVEGLTEAQLKDTEKYSSTALLEQLKKEEPSLFGGPTQVVIERPANSGTKPDPATRQTTPQKPEQTNTAQLFDAMTADKGKVSNRLKELGLEDPRQYG